MMRTGPGRRIGGAQLLPLLEPSFNCRQAAKEALLLEEHLCNPLVRCPNCIQKHFLKIEGLLDEALSLDVRDRRCACTAITPSFCGRIAAALRELMIEYIHADRITDPAGRHRAFCDIQQKLREHVRKPLQRATFAKTALIRTH